MHMHSHTQISLNRGQDTRANRTRHTASSKHTTTRKPATHERTQTNLTFTRTHTHLPNGDRCQRPTDTAPHDSPHDSHTHSATPTRVRASALASGTIACASSTDSTSANLRERLRPLPPLPLHLPLPPNLVKLEAGEARELRLTVQCIGAAPSPAYILRRPVRCNYNRSAGLEPDWSVDLL